MRRTSATGTEGFTLVEILVVVAIAGILVALAAANLFPSNEQIARREVSSVTLAVERARDAAWFGGTPTGITLEPGRLREWRYSGSSWEPSPGREQVLAEEVRVTGLFVDGAELKPGERLVFMPDGLGIPFRIAMDVRGVGFAIEGDPAGAVAMVAK